METLALEMGTMKKKNASHLKKIMANKLFGQTFIVRTYIFIITCIQTNNSGKSKFPLSDEMLQMKNVLSLTEFI